jgi:hypothetical protein
MRGGSLLETTPRAEVNLGRYKLQGGDKEMNPAKSGSRSNGYTEVKARPFSDRALHPEASAMGFHDMAGDREA